MFKVDVIAILLSAVVTVGIVLLQWPALDEIGLANSVNVGLSATLVGIWTIATMPFAFMMPRLRVGLFYLVWRVPSSTYVFPRWTVPLGVGTMLGHLIGVLILAITKDYQLFRLAGSFLLVFMAFFAAAWRRLTKHPNTEFTMRCWPRV
jgi:hypothetical protein